MTEPVSLNDLLDDIVGIYEVAQHLGVSIDRARRWTDRRETTGCPLPLKSLVACNLYSLRDWEGWFALWQLTHQKQANRPEEEDELEEDELDED